MGSEPYSGFVVVAMAEGANSTSVGSLDPLSTSETDLSDRGAFAVVGVGKMAVTDPSGVAVFDNLNMMDVYGDTVCVKFRFAIGESTTYYITDATETTICFKNNYQIQLRTTYSSYLAPNQDFYQPVSIRVRLDDFNDTINEGDVMTFAVFVKQVGATAPDLALTRTVLENNECIIRNG